MTSVSSPHRAAVAVVLVTLIAPSAAVARQVGQGGAAPAARPPEASPPAAPITTQLLREFRFRSIGPAVTGGRIHDIEIHPDAPSTIYVATASGGIWKTTNKGTTWTPVFDDQPVSTFGEVAAAPSNPAILYAGTGEQQNRQSTSWGNGVYRSNDAGSTWTHVGLDETRHIGRVIVHPTNPEIVYVAALGNLWKPSTERGVFKTTDGGRTWSRVLFLDTLTGVVDLEMDPLDPATLYAAAYQRLRRTWGMNGGGPGSGIYQTSDGGRTWRPLTNGLPVGGKGRIGLAVARSNPRVLNALVEHDSLGGTYRSEDGGESWQRVNSLDPRPVYYSHIEIDPTNERRVYVMAVSFYKSEDGGRTFRTMPTRPTYDVGVHSDFHAMWIDPSDPSHFYLAGDGGLYETWDMGETFAKLNNLAIGQFYAIGLDGRDPYWIYGGMQDNHSWMGPSATRHWTGIINDDWRQIGYGDGMYWQADPTDHRFVYGVAQNGEFTRLDAESGDLLDIRPEPLEGEPDYRWDWVTPLLVSRHNPAVVYAGGNRLFISRDRGVTWERTADLTRRIDRDTLRLMGVPGSTGMLSKHDGEQSFGEIVTIAESPLDPRILWVGTDDGNVQVSRDGGATWTEVSANVMGVPPGAYVSRVLSSGAAPGAAWVTFDAHRDGDFRPFVYRTTDFGGSWTARTDGLPPEGSVNVVLEHPDNPDVLFLGTEHALFLTTDRGVRWAKVPNLPTTLYDDLAIHPRDRDLVVATHGRSIWILDDAAPLAEWSRAIADRPAHLFRTRTATILQYWKDTSYRGQAAYAGENPPDGAILTYYLENDAGAPSIALAKADGAVVRTLDAPGGAGIHRVVWDLRYEPPPAAGFGGGGGEGGTGTALPRSVAPRAPHVPPGRYTVTLTAGDARATGTVEVRGDPLMPLTPAQYAARDTFVVRALDAAREAGAMAAQAASAGRDAAARGDGAAADSSRALVRRIQQLGGRARQLLSRFGGQGVRQGTLYPPTATHRELLERLERDLADLRERVAALRRDG